jgi:peroxiredoxin
VEPNDGRITVDPEHNGELAVGDLAPDFHLPASTGREVALDEYRGKQHVVLFFVRTFE